MNWRNRVLSKNSGALRPCRIDRRWAITVHSDSSCSAVRLPLGVFSSSAATQQGQQHELAGGGIGTVDMAVLLVQQAAADQPVHIALYHRRQVLVLPVHEQLALQVGIQRTDQTLDLYPVHSRIVQEQTGNQRRQSDQMQDVVPVPGQQHGLGLVQIENLAQG